MKKNYLLLLLCCLSVSFAQGTTYYSQNTLTASNSVAALGNWTTGSGGSGTSPTTFLNPADSFIVQNGMSIPSDTTWTVAGIVMFTYGRISKVGALSSIISIGGDLIMNCPQKFGLDSTFFTSAIAGAGDLYIYLYSDLIVDTNAYFSAGHFPGSPTPACHLHVHFSNTSIPAVIQNIYWTSTDTSKFTQIVIDPGATVQLQTNVPLPIFAGSNDSLNGTLICGSYTMSSNVTDTFVIDSAANIYTAHTGGLDSSIQQMAAIHFSGSAHYIFDGTAPQVTGLSMPSLFVPAGSDTINNAAGVTLSQATTFDSGSTVNLENGSYNIGTFLTMGSNTWVNVDNGNFGASHPTYVFPVNIEYEYLGNDALIFTTGNELLPTAPVTSIGKVVVNKPGASIIVGSAVTANDSLIIDSASSLDANVAGNYAITANRVWANYSQNATTGFIAELGTVILNGNDTETVGGNTITTFNNVLVSNTDGVYMGLDNIVINDSLYWTNSGNVYIDSNTLIFGANAASITRGAGTLGWIVADNTGFVRKIFNADGPFSFPIGDTTYFSPIQLDFTGSTYGTPSFSEVDVTPHKHPANANVSSYLNRYWTVIDSGFVTVDSQRVLATYVPTDVVGDADSMSMGEYLFALPWIKYVPATTFPYTLYASDTNVYSQYTGITSQPPSIVAPGPFFLCTGAKDTLIGSDPMGDGPLTFSWTPSPGLTDTFGVPDNTELVAIAAPSVTTTYTLTITDGNGFTSFATTTVSVNIAPTASVLPQTAVCQDETLNVTMFIANASTYLWHGPIPIGADSTSSSLVFYNAQPSATGVYSVTLTDGIGRGCMSHYTVSETVNPLPAATLDSSMGGDSVYCNSATLYGYNGGSGTMYFQGGISDNTATSTFPTPSAVVSTTGTYYFRAVSGAGCWGPQGSITVTVNPLPNVYDMTVGGNDPLPPAVALSMSIGNSGAILPAPTDVGTFESFLPIGYCAGDSGYHIGLLSSDPGVNYQLYNSYGPLGSPIAGTGFPIDFGLDTVGFYNITAINATTGCTNYMNQDPFADSVFDSVYAFPLPIPYPLSLTIYPDGSDTLGADVGYCFGSPGLGVQLYNGDYGVNYNLYYKDTVTGDTAVLIDMQAGVGMSINFGIDTGSGIYTAQGVYYVIATDGNSCVSAMANKDSLWVNPLPNIYSVTGFGTICSLSTGLPIILSGSDTGVAYSVFDNGSTTAVASGILGNGGIDTLTLQPSGTSYPVGPNVYTVIGVNALTTCSVNMLDSAVINVNPLPGVHTVTGGGAFCAGDTVTADISFNVCLDGSDIGIQYQLYYQTYGGIPSPLDSPVMGTGSPICFGMFTGLGTYTVYAVDTATGCNNNMNSGATIVMNPVPLAFTLTGGGKYCYGGAGFTLTLSGSQNDTIVNGTDIVTSYQLYNTGFPVGPPQTGTGDTLTWAVTDSGVYTVIATNGYVPSCATAMNGSDTVVVFLLPNIYNMVGGGAYCISDSTPYHVGLLGSDSGIIYDLYRGTTKVDSLFGTNADLDFGATNTPGTYTVVATNATTGCTDNMSGAATVTANILPNIDTLVGGGSYCATSTGIPLALDSSQSGVTYQLYISDSIATGSPVSGTGSALPLGVETAGGVYNVVATITATGCQNNMHGTSVVIVNPLPHVYTIAGGGAYCASDTGVHIFLDASNVGIAYQLFFDGTSYLGPIAGTGFGLDYGLITTPGAYDIIATNTTTLCTDSMAGVVNITINPLPVVYNVSGDGSYCSGGSGLPVALSGSNTGIHYQLYIGSAPAGTPLTGTGSPITFGPETAAGTYTVVAKDIYTNCPSDMTGSATIAVNPLPARDTVSGGGAYCAGGTGATISLSGSASGVNYTLKDGVTTMSVMPGTGSAISFGSQTLAGTYKVIASNTTTTCTDTMLHSATIIVHPLPPVFNVSGGGTYCSSDTGLHVDLSGSDTGISYQLYLGTGSTGFAVRGTGSPLDMGLQTAAGTYTVVATNTRTSCMNDMNDSAVIAIQPYSVPVATVTALGGTHLRVGQSDELVVTVTSGGGGAPTFQWLVNGNPIAGATSDTFAFNSLYFTGDSIICEVTSSGMCGGVTDSFLTVITLFEDVVQQVAATSGDIRLVPNPNKGAFTLKGTLGNTADEDVTVEVTDMLGQVVYKETIPVHNGVINENIQLSNTLANGMYLLNLRSGTHNDVFHFVVEQ